MSKILPLHFCHEAMFTKRNLGSLFWMSLTETMLS